MCLRLRKTIGLFLSQDCILKWTSKEKSYKVKIVFRFGSVIFKSYRKNWIIFSVFFHKVVTYKLISRTMQFSVTTYVKEKRVKFESRFNFRRVFVFATQTIWNNITHFQWGKNKNKALLKLFLLLSTTKTNIAKNKIKNEGGWNWRMVLKEYK